VSVFGLKVLRHKGNFVQGFFQAPREQGACDIGAHLDTRSHLTELGCAFQQHRLGAFFSASPSRGQTTNPATHNEN
jgi:hypothetical protein